MRLRITLLLMAMLVMLFAGCMNLPDDVAAKVGDKTITIEELEQSAGRARFKTADDEMEKKLDIVNRLVEQKLMVLGAYDAGFDKDTTITNRLKTNSDRYVLQALYVREIEKKSEPTQAEIDEYIKDQSEEIRASHILVDDESEAKEIYESIKTGADFAKLAEEKSKDPGSGKNGGDLGWFTRGRMVPEFEEKAFTLAKGEIGEPVKSQFGWHIIKVIDKREKDTNEFREDLTRTKEMVKRQKQVKLRDGFIKDLVDGANFKFDEKAIEVVISRYNEAKAFNEKLNEEKGKDPQGVRPKFEGDELKMVLCSYKGGELTLQGLDTLLSKARPFSMPDLNNNEAIEDYVKNRTPIMQDLLRLKAEELNIKQTPEFKENYDTELEQIMVNEFKTKVIEEGAKPSEEEKKAYYEENKSEFIQPERITVTEIQVASKNEAEALLKRVKGGESIEVLASKFTLRNSAKKNAGKLNNFTEKRYPELFKAAKPLAVGEYAGPVENDRGKFSIIKLESRTEQQQKPFDGVVRLIESKLARTKKEEATTQWVENAKNKYKVVINEAAIKATIDMAKYGTTNEKAAPQKGQVSAKPKQNVPEPGSVRKGAQKAAPAKAAPKATPKPEAGK